jgi:hypothetical protein
MYTVQLQAGQEEEPNFVALGGMVVTKAGYDEQSPGYFAPGCGRRSRVCTTPAG